MSRFISYVFVVFIVITCAILFVPAVIIWLVTFPFDKRKVILHQYTCFWGAFYTWVAPFWKVRILDRKKFKKDRVYVVVSNHQSQLDILVAFNLFRHFKWVSKLEIFKIPFIGWNMYLNRYVPLVRGDKKSIEEMMNVSEERLREGSSVYFFPEGTRSPDDQIRSFKPGAFILAHKLKTPILPIAITGTNKALPKYSMNVDGMHKIYFQVLDEIPYEKYSHLSVEETGEMVRKTIIEAADKLKSKK